MGNRVACLRAGYFRDLRIWWVAVACHCGGSIGLKVDQESFNEQRRMSLASTNHLSRVAVLPSIAAGRRTGSVHGPQSKMTLASIYCWRTKNMAVGKWAMAC